MIAPLATGPLTHAAPQFVSKQRLASDSMFGAHRSSIATIGQIVTHARCKRLCVPMPNFDIQTFDDLLRAARRQADPQRLLFVFARAELPEDSTPEQRTRFDAGVGGALIPLMCVDKGPDELGTFSELVEESCSLGLEWTIVFVASLAGQGGRAPTSESTEAPLQSMVEAIKAGTHRSFIPFDRNGRPVLFE